MPKHRWNSEKIRIIKAITFWLIVFIGVSFFLYLLFNPSKDAKYFSSQSSDDRIDSHQSPELYLNLPEKGKNLIESSQKCFIDVLNEWKTSLDWTTLNKVVNRCTFYIIHYIPYITATPLYDERRYYMLPRASYINDTCSSITFGVGGSIAAEEHIKMSLPHCTFLGFDPNGDYKNLFTDNLNGTFVQTAAGGKDIERTIYQLGKDNIFKESPQKLQIRSIAKLIELYHGTEALIDHLSIDVEGFEYSVLEEMLLKADIYANVCQFNIEFHAWWIHDTGYKFWDVVALLKKFIQDGTFIWVKADTHLVELFPSFFINVKNEKCIEKYLKNRLL